MSSSKKIFVVAGEESGDIHAASFIQQLKAKYPDLDVKGIGGQHMVKAGANILSDLAKFGVTGLSEVLEHAFIIKKAYDLAKKQLTIDKPDLLVLVDYPGFNLRLAKFAKQRLGIPVLYYISPQIWAWKAGRIKTIRENVSHMAVILPFEKQIYQNTGVPVSFVGHPLVEKIKPAAASLEIKKQFNLPLNKRLIALLPGSRVNEIKRLLPILIEAAELLSQKFSDLHFLLPVAESLEQSYVETFFKQTNISHTLIRGNAVPIASCSDMVVVASGTASLEVALLAKPMCIIYKVSLLTSLVACKLVKIKYLGLCNLLSNSMIVPELLQYDCNALEIVQLLEQWLGSPDSYNSMLNDLNKMRSNLSSQAADCSITELIETLLI